MKIISTKIKDIKKIKTRIFKDQRGFFKEVYQNKIFKKSLHSQPISQKSLLLSVTVHH